MSRPDNYDTHKISLLDKAREAAIYGYKSAYETELRWAFAALLADARCGRPLPEIVTRARRLYREAWEREQERNPEVTYPRRWDTGRVDE